MDLRVGAGALVASITLVVALPALAQPTAPPPGAWFRYRYEERLRNGTGEYEGYTESTVADARYEVLSVEADRAEVQAQYAWTYSSPERTESDSIDRTVAFTLPDRRYEGPRTDSSDYDAFDARELHAWMWIPPLEPGARLAILDRDDFVVIGAASVTVGGAERDAVLVQAEYDAERNDDYGQLRAHVVDRYWFDRATGMFLREDHVEQRDGTYEGRAASFVLVTTVEVIDASYAPAATPPPPFDPTPPRPEPVAADGPGPCPCICFALFALPFAFLWWRKRRRRPVRVMGDGRSFDIATPHAMELGAQPLASELGGPFRELLPHLVAVTRASGNAVHVARSGGSIVGIALADKESGVGTIFASDSDVCEELRRATGHTEFFSDVRHAALASVKRSGLAAPPHAYNVYETYDVLELRARPDELGYDPQVVSRMRDDERGAVRALLDAVYRVPSSKWLDAALAHGDLVWVARVDGRIVGVAMASVVGSIARLHTLTVDPAMRQKGLGTALYRARLRALFDLGVTRVITECATWNLAACELARAHGFQPIGKVYVETSRSQREERHFVRR